MGQSSTREIPPCNTGDLDSLYDRDRRAELCQPEALRHLRRDCMNEHLLLDGRTVVTWSKGRSNRQQRRSFLRDKSLSVPNLIERVLAMTAPLVPHAPAPIGSVVPGR